MVACSSGSNSSNNGGSNGGNTGDLSTLTFTAPNIIPSMPTLVGQGYIVDAKKAHFKPNYNY